MSAVQRRGVGRPRSDDSIARPIYTQERSFSYWIGVRKREFEQMPESAQRATLANVRRLLAREKNERDRKVRNDASPLARSAFRVYGIWVTWLPAAQQLDEQLDELLLRRISESLS